MAFGASSCASCVATRAAWFAKLYPFHVSIAFRSVGSVVGFATKQLGETHESKIVLGKTY
jgi:hypothetical protein